MYVHPRLDSILELCLTFPIAIPCVCAHLCCSPMRCVPKSRMPPIHFNTFRNNDKFFYGSVSLTRGPEFTISVYQKVKFILLIFIVALIISGSFVFGTCFVRNTYCPFICCKYPVRKRDLVGLVAVMWLLLFCISSSGCRGLVYRV